MLHRSINAAAQRSSEAIMVAKTATLNLSRTYQVPGTLLALLGMLALPTFVGVAVLLPASAWISAAGILVLGIAALFADARRRGVLDLPKVRYTVGE
jgi:hypothetical protein